MNGGECYAQGGDVEGDEQSLMAHCAQEMMDAIESKDPAKFLDGFKALMASMMNEMGESQDVNG